MGNTVVLTGVGRDRVGIVAEVAKVLYDLGCNLLDSSMTLLRGEFAIILMVQTPEQCTLSDLERKLARVESQLGFKMHARELSEAELGDNEAPGIMHMISVYGADKPGIVVAVTSALADLGVNITDVETQYSGSDPSKPTEKTVFLMVLEVSVPLEITTAEVEKKLAEVSKDLDVHTSMQVIEVNEL